MKYVEFCSKPCLSRPGKLKTKFDLNVLCIFSYVAFFVLVPIGTDTLYLLTTEKLEEMWVKVSVIFSLPATRIDSWEIYSNIPTWLKGSEIVGASFGSLNGWLKLGEWLAMECNGMYRIYKLAPCTSTTPPANALSLLHSTTLFVTERTLN